MDSRFLPDGFVDAYEALCGRALNDGSGMEGRPTREESEGAGGIGKETGSLAARGGNVRVSSGAETIVGGKGTGRAWRGKAQVKIVGRTGRGMRDERMFQAKVRIDKRLRQLGREIMDLLDGKDIKSAGRRICAGKCARLGQGDWSYCPNCGSAMRELDSGDASVHSA